MSEFPVEDVPEDYGPDFSQSRDRPEEKTDREGATKLKPRMKLGQNKKARSGIRKLTQEDREKIVGFYYTLSMATMPFHSEGSKAFAQSAESCADHWMKLAEQNDAVRKFLLGIMEGGAVMGLVAAHLPIAMAFVPEDSLPFKLPDFTMPIDDLKQDNGEQ